MSTNTEAAECPFCNSGSVDLYVGKEYHGTDQCQECDGSGNMTVGARSDAMSGINELEKHFADEIFKY